MAEALSALLWDVDGTLAETELEGHRVAFNRSFAAAGLPWHWNRPTYRRLLAVSGGLERIAAFLRQVEGREPDRQRVERLQEHKQAFYGELVSREGLPLRPGVGRLVAAAKAAGLRQGIVTTSGRAAVSALLAGAAPALAGAFDFWICGEDVSHKKPDPEAYHQALQLLSSNHRGVLVIEDSPAGLAAANGAGLACLVCRSAATREQPADGFLGARAVIENLQEPAGEVVVHRGPPCPGSEVTLSWLQCLLEPP